MPAFTKSVFVNCPFDSAYRPFFDALVFTIEYLGMTARSSYEASDAGEPRITKLIRIMAGSRYGIHDLSRCRAKKQGELYRLNMPLELGIDLGCQKFGTGRQKKKRILVLDKHTYRLQKAVSDLSGSDIKAHKDSVKELVSVVSGWLVLCAKVNHRAPSEIRRMHLRYEAARYENLLKTKHSPADMRKIPQHVERLAMRRWIKQNKPHKAGQYN